jgi:biopolymer transport protein ExbD
MAFHVSKRKLKPKEEDEMGELNIVPYLDILMNLIIFILLSMTGLATFGVLNVSAPSYGGGGGGANNEAPELLLTIGVAKNGYYVAAQGGVLPGLEQNAEPGKAPPTVAVKADGTYDYVALTEKLKEVKSAVAGMIAEGKVAPSSGSKVILAADAETPYEVIVNTMDASRETTDHKLLFPDVTLASF